MNCYHAIYIPSTLSGNDKAPESLRNTIIRNVKIRLSENFGGFTAWDAKGGWVSDQYGLIEEDVTIIKAYHDPDSAADYVVNGIAREVCRLLSQEAVTVETERGIEFITKEEIA